MEATGGTDSEGLAVLEEEADTAETGEIEEGTVAGAETELIESGEDFEIF